MEQHTMTSLQSQQMQKKFAWVYLCNLVFYLWPVFFVSYSTMQLVMIGAVLVVFIPLYFWAFNSPPSRIWRPVLLMWILASLIAPLNAGAIALFTYVGYFTGFSYRLRTALYALAGQVMWLFVLDQWLLNTWQYFFMYGAALVAVVFFIGVAERKRQQAEARDIQNAEEKRQLGAQLERERIARDLHDVLGHSLSSIALKIELADKLLERSEIEAARQQLRELMIISKESLSQVRESISGYRHQGLQTELQYLIERMREREIDVKQDGALPQLSKLVESSVVLALTELVTNILRHSNADQVIIYSYQHQSAWCIEVTDNGQSNGFEPGDGMQGIKERMAILGGSVDWTCTKDGVCCRLCIPFAVSEEQGLSD